MKTRCSQRIRWTNPGVRSLKKVVQVEYPDCVKIDTMTRAEYHRWQASDWPPGTRVWINGVKVRMLGVVWAAVTILIKPP